MEITKNGLTFKQAPDGSLLCQEILEFTEGFKQRYGTGEVEKAVDLFLSLWRNGAIAFDSDEPSAKNRVALGRKRFDAALVRLIPKVKRMSTLERLLFWFCSLGPELALFNHISNTHIDRDRFKMDMLSQFLVQAFPMPIWREVVGHYGELRGAASHEEHFALLFEQKDGGGRDTQVRRIVTDTQLIEIRDITGYRYINMMADGKTLCRWACDKHPEDRSRAFFDGIRLMRHPRLTTCAPHPVFSREGYAVESHGCTIINGMLYDVFLKRGKQNESVPPDRIGQDWVGIGGEKKKPIGRFLPSKITLLDSGFSLYGWSEFQPTM